MYSRSNAIKVEVEQKFKNKYQIFVTKAGLDKVQVY